MYRTAIFHVDESPGLRLDRWLAERLDGSSRSQIQHALEAGRILVGGIAQPARYRVRLGDEISCEIEEEASTELQPEAIPLRIVYEDAHLLVIDKPAGLVVHPAPGHRGGTVANALLAHCGPSLEGVGGEGRWGIVHRLDRGTSGLMMAARTQPAYEALVGALAERRVRRRYIGIVPGMFTEAGGTIDRPIGRRTNDRKRMGIVPDGREARTDFTILCQSDGMALLGLALHSGRTHQIRVHLQSIGKPILADTEYGWTRPRTLQGFPQNLRPRIAELWPARPALHAAQLSFMHPINERMELSFRSNPPEDMTAILEMLWPGVWAEALERWLAGAPEISDESKD